MMETALIILFFSSLAFLCLGMIAFNFAKMKYEDVLAERRYNQIILDKVGKERARLESIKGKN